MSNILLSWDYPIPTSRQRPLRGAVIFFRVAESGFPFVLHSEVPVARNTQLIEDVDDGDYEYALEIADVDDRRSSRVTTTVRVNPPEPQEPEVPSPALNFTGSVVP